MNDDDNENKNEIVSDDLILHLYFHCTYEGEHDKTSVISRHVDTFYSQKIPTFDHISVQND